MYDFKPTSGGEKLKCNQKQKKEAPTTPGNHTWLIRILDKLCSWNNCRSISLAPWVLQNFRMSDGFKVLVAPDSAVHGQKEGCLTMITLSHPRSKEETLFALSTADNSTEIYEVVNLEEDIGSWMLGGDRISGGEGSGMKMVVPMDPVFLVLPLLSKQEAKVPLDHLIADNVPHHQMQYYDHLMPAFAARLPKVADACGTPDLNVWKWNSAKAMEYLSRKCLRLAKKLEETNIQTDGASSDILAKTSTEKDRVRMSWEIVSEFLEEDIAESLKSSLNIQDKQDLHQPSPKLPRLSSESGDRLQEVSDYSSNQVLQPPKPTSKLTAKQKALARASGGTRGIGAFFKKK